MAWPSSASVHDRIIFFEGMLAVFQGLPYELRMKLDEGAYHISFDFNTPS